MSMEECVEAIVKRGIGVVMSGVWRGKKGLRKCCLLDTREMTGTVFETIEFSED